MAGWGDPAWDVGSVLGERHEASVERAFWDAYARARRLSATAAAQLLRRARRFAGARIVQSAFEHTQEVTALDDEVVRDVAAARALLLGEAA
jgi:hypothetical protein